MWRTLCWKKPPVLLFFSSRSVISAQLQLPRSPLGQPSLLIAASGSFFLQVFYIIFQSKVTSSHLHHNLTSLVPPATLQTRLVVNVEGECEEQLETPML